MVGLPGFEPGSRDPQPRSIGQANLQALSGYSSANLFAQSLADVSGISGEAEGGYIVYQIDMADEHPINHRELPGRLPLLLCARCIFCIGERPLCRNSNI